MNSLMTVNWLKNRCLCFSWVESMKTAKVGRGGQITLPRDVRERLQLEQGHSVAFVEKGGEITLQPLSRSLRDLRGSVSVDEPQDFDAVREAVKMGRLESKDD